MHDAVERMLEKYDCGNTQEYRHALKEILQEIALFGLWRCKFFEHTAFYGGTALRILYGLNRFSEDLDFSLLRKKSSFDLSKFEDGMKREIEAFGFPVTVDTKVKKSDSVIQSAFIKANTLEHLVKIGLPDHLTRYVHSREQIKIKFEVDIDPPLRFNTQAIPIFKPAPFSVRTYALPDMFAGKLSALLYRQWGKRVKGRDWFDFLWFVGNRTPLNLDHLQARISQIEPSIPESPLSLALVQEMIHKKIDSVNLSLAKEDVLPFIRDQRLIEGWNKELFHAAVEQITAQ